MAHLWCKIWVFPKIGVPQMFIMENPIKMDDLGVPLLSETPILTLLHWIDPRPWGTRRLQKVIHTPRQLTAALGWLRSEWQAGPFQTNDRYKWGYNWGPDKGGAPNSVLNGVKMGEIILKWPLAKWVACTSSTPCICSHKLQETHLQASFLASSR